MSWLQEHPFAVDAFFRRSLVLAYSAPIADVRALLPAQLEPDTFDGIHGFVAVALVDTLALRPAGFPKFPGRNFMLAGYRIFARFRTQSGKRLRGLYILRSETDRRGMVLLGNLFTKYKYHRAPISMSVSGDLLCITNGEGGLMINAETTAGAALPASSVFRDWQEARRFAGPLPFTFSASAGASHVTIVEGAREHWTPRPVHIQCAQIPLFETLFPRQLKLANAFLVEDIPYHWKKGRRELWLPDAAGSRD